MTFTRVLGPGIHTASNINSHNINSTGIITAVSFVGDGSGLTGVASTDNIVTGTAATFTGGVDINSDIDVDGHTNLDNVSIAGVTTLSGSLTGTTANFSGGLTGTTANFSGGLTGTTANFSGNVTVGGVLTYEDVKNVDSLGIITARSGIDVDDFLDVGSNIKLGNAGVITATSYRGDGSQLTGIVAGLSTIGGVVNVANDLDVDGHTNLDNVSVAGVTTFSGNANFTNPVSFGGDSAADVEFKNGNNTRIRFDVTENGLVFLSNSYLYFDQNGTVIYRAGQDTRMWTQDTSKNLSFGTNTEKLEVNNAGVLVSGIVTATAFKLADGSAVGAGAGGTWSTYTAGIATSKSVGVNTSNLDDNDLVGVGNSFQGLYISNGMIIHDNTLNGNHYIGTTMNGLMAGPVNIEGTLTIDGNYVVV